MRVVPRTVVCRGGGMAWDGRIELTLLMDQNLQDTQQLLPRISEIENDMLIVKRCTPQFNGAVHSQGHSLLLPPVVESLLGSCVQLIAYVPVILTWNRLLECNIHHLPRHFLKHETKALPVLY